MNLKQRIRSGEDVLGLAVPVTIGRDDLAALMPTGPYDFVSVDSQHAPYDEERLTAFCAMTAEMDIPVQFRIKHTQHTYLVGNYLDRSTSRTWGRATSDGCWTRSRRWGASP